MMKIRIRRSDPRQGQPSFWQEYDVPVRPGELTVMQLLDHIADYRDGSLAYFRHSACMHGICGRCRVKVDGKVRLACLWVPVGEEVVLEPAGEPVLRDLVCG